MTSSMETDFTQGHPERSYQHELLIWQQNEIRKLKLTKEWKTRNGMKGDDFNVPLLKSQSPLPPKRLNRREKQDLCKVTSIQFHQVVHFLRLRSQKIYEVEFCWRSELFSSTSPDQWISGTRHVVFPKHVWEQVKFKNWTVSAFATGEEKFRRKFFGSLWHG